MAQFSWIIMLAIVIWTSNLPSVHLKFRPRNSLPYFRHIPSKTFDPINIDTSNIVDLILPPIILTGHLTNIVKVVNTGKSVEVILDQPTTLSVTTGGILNNETYAFHKIKYVWTDNPKGISGVTIDSVGYPIENIAIFYNIKYGTFENALHHRDGLVSYVFFISVDCIIPNVFFNLFAPILKQVLKPGPTPKTLLGISVLWSAAVVIPTTTYYAYPGSYIDEITGKRYFCTTTIIIPHLPITCLSKKQFEETFGSFRNSSGQPLTNKESQFPRNVEVVRSRGLLHIVF